MNILLTNDDGFEAKGIRTLYKLLQKYGNVVIVAPDSPRSAGSASVTLDRPIQLVKVEENIFKCSGTPVDCVSLGLCVLNMDFDIVVSGCNNGLNISYDTMYSATVGAALEALMFFKPAVAFSAYPGTDFSEVEEYFDKVWEYINNNKLLSNEYMLNVNFPENEVKGMALGGLYYRHDQNYFSKDEKGFWALRHTQTNFDDDKETDCYQVRHGIISIVPLNRTYYQKGMKEKLQSKLK